MDRWCDMIQPLRERVYEFYFVAGLFKSRRDISHPQGRCDREAVRALGGYARRPDQCYSSHGRIWACEETLSSSFFLIQPASRRRYVIITAVYTLIFLKTQKNLTGLESYCNV